ncbi:MAG: hypothetical protein JRN08_03220 [Nitrososphaerota archaeon]|nr:hypothetical protein [Nitrososphaerota archaeon]
MGSGRVYFAVFGSGLGHITRTLDIAGRLDGHQCLFSTSGQGLDHVRSRGAGGARALAAPPLDVEWDKEGFSSWDVLPRLPFTFSAFLSQLAFERRSIGKFDPSVVVSDSRLSPILAARGLSYPVVTMLNQFVISFPPRFRSRTGRFLERIAGDVLGKLWSLSDRVLMTDLPPPYTIAETNLLGSDMSGVVEFVGFTAPRKRVEGQDLAKARGMVDAGRKPLVFCQISGPEVTKKRFSETIMQAAPGLTRDFDLVVSLGRSGGSTAPKRLASGAWVFEWCPVKDELFELADLVVARAGHSTIGQCIDGGKPAVLVPIYNHPEQIGNGEKFAKLGLGKGIRSEKLTAGSLSQAVRECLGDAGYGRRAQAVAEVSKRYNGVERSAEIIRSYR